MGGDSAFAEDHPRVVAAAEVDDRCGDGTSCGAAIDDEGDRVAKLLENAAGVGAFGQAAEVGRGGCDGQAKFFDHGAANGGLRHAQGYVAGVGGDAEGELAAGFDDDGEWAGPEAFGEAVEVGVNTARQLVGLRDIGDEQ